MPEGAICANCESWIDDRDCAFQCEHCEDCLCDECVTPLVEETVHCSRHFREAFQKQREERTRLRKHISAVARMLTPSMRPETDPNYIPPAETVRKLDAYVHDSGLDVAILRGAEARAALGEQITHTMAALLNEMRAWGARQEYDHEANAQDAGGAFEAAARMPLELEFLAASARGLADPTVIWPRPKFPDASIFEYFNLVAPVSVLANRRLAWAEPKNGRALDNRGNVYQLAPVTEAVAA